MADETVTLAYTEWAVVELDGEPVELGPEALAPNLSLDLEESRVIGSGGVNRFAGTFAMTGGELRFGPLATTRMAGPEDAMRLERGLLEALARVTAYELEGRVLTLLADGEPVVRLAC